jgi:hypothetical protein
VKPPKGSVNTRGNAETGRYHAQAEEGSKPDLRCTMRAVVL